MKKELITDILAMLILIMWLYAGFSKFFDWGTFRRAMTGQPFGLLINTVLLYTLPPLEIIVAFLLIFNSTRSKGFVASSVLMLLFTVYISFVLMGIFPKRPCSCGGIIQQLHWKGHLIFNIIFLTIALTGTWLNKRRTKTPYATA